MGKTILSIIIVNYNVRYFLEQCLCSVRKAIQNIPCEIFVVDNNSYDKSCEMVSTKFPEIKLIQNKENVGFSRANNQAIKLSSGKYVLLLNPDTLVKEDTFQKVIDFMNITPDAGGVGVKMIDGNGKFLPESKRGLPTPLTAFYKIFGLSKIFPRSNKFGKYHLTYLDKDTTNPVDVLSGAFMMLRKTMLDQIGLLDETFFMYGEDIDLSYRIKLAGYKNYYFADTTIIHYKGESTKKNSINYVIIFYNAMEIFFQKHFQSKLAGLYSIAVKLAIYMRACTAIIRRSFFKIAIPLVDAIFLWLFFFTTLPAWENYRLGEEGAYPASYMFFAVPVYIIIWTVTILYSKGYDKPFKTSNLWKSIFAGSFIILLFYSLLPEQYRYSRAMILFATLYASIILPILRLIYGKMHIDGYFYKKKHIRIVIIGTQTEESNITSIIKKHFKNIEYIGYINNEINENNKLGTIADLHDIVRVNNIDEIIFGSSTLSNSEIINAMMLLQAYEINFKIASLDGISIIGSSTILTNSELYNIDLRSTSTPANKRLKRTFDMLFAFALLITYPITLFTVNFKGQLFINIFQVITGKKTWVGYAPSLQTELPHLKQGILSPLSLYRRKQNIAEAIDKLNLIYAKDYKLLTDITIILKSWRYLGNK